METTQGSVPAVLSESVVYAPDMGALLAAQSIEVILSKG